MIFGTQLDLVNKVINLIERMVDMVASFCRQLFGGDLEKVSSVFVCRLGRHEEVQKCVCADCVHCV